MERITNACFTLGVKANVQTKSSSPIHAKIEINPKGFIIIIKTKKKKNQYVPS